MPREEDPRQLREHPLGHLVPDMRPGFWKEFLADVALRGVRVPLEVVEDGEHPLVVDGRHRLRAALSRALEFRERMILRDEGSKGGSILSSCSKSG